MITPLLSKHMISRDVLTLSSRQKHPSLLLRLSFSLLLLLRVSYFLSGIRIRVDCCVSRSSSLLLLLRVSAAEGCDVMFEYCLCTRCACFLCPRLASTLHDVNDTLLRKHCIPPNQLPVNISPYVPCICCRRLYQLLLVSFDVMDDGRLMGLKRTWTSI